MKIGPVDNEMALLIVKKEEITEGKIYIPFGHLAERAKQSNEQLCTPPALQQHNEVAQSPHLIFNHALYKQVCNKHSDKSNRWSLNLSVCSTSVRRRRCDKQ